MHIDESKDESAQNLFTIEARKFSCTVLCSISRCNIVQHGTRFGNSLRNSVFAPGNLRNIREERVSRDQKKGSTPARTQSQGMVPSTLIGFTRVSSNPDDSVAISATNGSGWCESQQISGRSWQPADGMDQTILRCSWVHLPFEKSLEQYLELHRRWTSPLHVSLLCSPSLAAPNR
jgi:hypothetical protein